MQKVTATELELLKLLWDRGELTARQIAEVLYPECSASDIGTVHSMLKRLERKKAVRRSRRTHPHRFSAKVTVQQIAGFELGAIADKLSEGSMAPFLLHLVSAKKLTREEADEIRQLLKNYNPSNG